MATSSARLVSALSIALLSLVGAGCGGGSGSGEFVIPGTLTPLALEGQPAPTGGTYALFAPDVLLEAANGGWVAFVANIALGPVSKALFVARPNGAVVTVYSVGETVPSASGATGTIADFRRVWMRPDGIVVAHVTIAAGSVEAFLTARVDAGGAVVEKVTAYFIGQDLPNGVADPGTLAAIDEDATQVDDVGDIFFHGTGSTALHGVFAVSRSGLAVAKVALTGDPAVGGGVFGADFPAIGIDEFGLLAAFAAEVVGGPSIEGIFATFDGVSFVRAADNSLSPPTSGGRQFLDVYEDGPLHVSLGGGLGFVTWRGQVTGPAPDHGIYTRQIADSGFVSLGTLQTIVGPAEPLTGVGGGAFANDVFLFTQVIDPLRVLIRVNITAGTSAHVFASSAGAGSFAEIFREGDTAPGAGGGDFGITYPSLDLQHFTKTDRIGSFAFTGVLTNAATGIWWPVFGSDFFQVVREGEPAPGTGGGSFASFFTPSSVSTATGVVAFRAALSGGTSATGIFRQG